MHEDTLSVVQTFLQKVAVAVFDTTILKKVFTRDTNHRHITTKGFK
jgi:hypothetical protein